MIKAYIVNEDQGPYGEQVEAVLRDIRPLRLVGARTVEGADEKVAEGEAPAAIIILTDFSARIDANQPVRVQLIKDPTHQEEARAVAGILNEMLTALRVRAEPPRRENRKTGEALPMITRRPDQEEQGSRSLP